MEFNVAQLMKEPTGARREFALDDDITHLDTALRPLSHLRGSLGLLRIHSGILATGDFQVMLELQCGRCLEQVALPIALQFEESFRPLTDIGTGRFLSPEEFEGQEDDLTDEALLIDEQHILNISEVVRQNIWLSIPIVAGCSYFEPDECPNYQKLLSEFTVVKQDDERSPAEAAGIDPRWAALLALQDESLND